MWTFAQPEVREAQVFAQMPSAFRRTGARSDWADANRGGQDTDSFLEGPVFDAAGNLFVTDIPFGRIFRIDSAGSWALVAEYDGEPNGMANNFDLNDLQAFRAVAESSNFRRAAEALHISQPAFSRRIEKLEEALGVRLLDRTTRRVSLTAVGREFDRKVRTLLDELDNMSVSVDVA